MYRINRPERNNCEQFKGES